MDSLTYELLSWLEAGNSVLRPRASTDAESNFDMVVQLLRQLRDQQLVVYLDGHVSQAESGTYLMIGPVQLTPKGIAALQRDRDLGPRPAWTGSLPWRD